MKSHKHVEVKVWAELSGDNIVEVGTMRVPVKIDLNGATAIVTLHPRLTAMSLGGFSVDREALGMAVTDLLTVPRPLELEGDNALVYAAGELLLEEDSGD